MRWSLKRARQVATVWSWLPGFRAVGESEHLPTAAQESFVSVSALSRTVSQLEQQLDTELFRREGRGIKLNAEGRILLSAVREAMRRVHDAIEVITHTEQSGVLNIAARTPTALQVIVPALPEIHERFPKLEPCVVSQPDSALAEGLLSGAIDLAVLEGKPKEHPELHIHRIGEFSLSIYAAASHPLMAKGAPKKLMPEEVLKHPFVAPPSGGEDGWPPEIQREIGWRTDILYTGLGICGTGLALAFVSDRIAQGFPNLHRVPVDIGTTKDVYLACRQPLAETSVPEEIAEILIATFNGEEA